MTRTLGMPALLIAGLVLLLSPTSNQADNRPVLSLVIDDLGYSFSQAQQVLDLPGSHTFAIIPSTTYSSRIARYAHDNGHEVILHMPMQSSTDLIMESSALHDSMSEKELTESVTNMIREVPHIKGVNNHMGSRLTELGYMMRPVMETIKQHSRRLYFLDSRTTPLSQAYQHAMRAGVPTMKRDVFLDFDGDNAEVTAQQFDLWIKKAREKGFAIAIAHPYQSTLEVLQEKLSQVTDEFQFLPLSELIQLKHKETHSWPRYLSHLQQDSKNSKQ